MKLLFSAPISCPPLIGSVRLTQLEMAELLDAKNQNISLHLKNLFEERDFESAPTFKESMIAHIECIREGQPPVN